MPRLVIASAVAARLTDVSAALSAVTLDVITVTAEQAWRLQFTQPWDVAIVDAAWFVNDRMHAEPLEVTQLEVTRNEHGAVLVLTEPGDVTQRLQAFEAGADDCLEYPCHPQELRARVQVMLRRHGNGHAQAPRDTQTIVAGELVLQPRSLSANLAGQPLVLTSTQFNLLALLAREPGQVLSRDQLAQQVLGRQLSPYDRSIDTHISHLRRKLSCEGRAPLAIRSVRGNGYVLLLNET